MSATLDSMRTRYSGTADAPRTISEKSREHAEVLRAALGRPAAHGQSAVRARVDAVRNNPARWAGPTRTAPAPVAVTKPDYKVADELAMTVPVGFYALPRKEASAAGNTITFFKVHPFRGGRRIVQLLGSVGAFSERPLPVQHQVFALTHIAENAKAAAVLFGRETATCGMCGSPLTNEASRKAGIGPKCARKF